MSAMSDQPSTPDDAPSGLPPDEPERGPDAMPGIPTEGEPPAAS